VSAVGQVSAAELAGEVSAQVSGEVLAPVLVPRLAVVPNSNRALCNALVPDQRTKSRRCRHRTKGSQSSPFASCNCWEPEESERMSAARAWDLAHW